MNYLPTLFSIPSVRNVWIFALFLTTPVLLWASGTRQVAPTEEDGIVMLETNRPEFGNFAAFGAPDSVSGLVITINDPSEVLFIGLSGEFNDNGRVLGTVPSRYRFRIVDGNGMVVHGPFIINSTNANVSSWNDALFGNYAVDATQNVAGQSRLIYRFEPTAAGDYYVQFQDISGDSDTNSKVNIGFWDFTVTQNGSVVDGRVWSRNWAFRTPPIGSGTLPECDWNRPFNGVLYSYTSDGFVSRIDFGDSGFQGLSFNVAFNRRGPGDSDDLREARKSIPGRNATDNSAEHRIFLQPPDPVVFVSGDCGTIIPSTSFKCVGVDSFCIDVFAQLAGQVEIILDFNQNGEFDPENNEIFLVEDFPENNMTICVGWNGRGADGQIPTFEGSTINLIVRYTRGVQHYAVYDQEFLKNGFCISTVRPECARTDNNLLYWNDTNIPVEPGTGQPKDGRDGCECRQDGCRTWTNFDANDDDCVNIDDSATEGYGDKNTLNTWWFANITIDTIENVQLPITLLGCNISGNDVICDDGTTEFTAAVNQGNFTMLTYEWSGPGGFTASTAATGTISLPGVYSVTITNEATGCETVCSRTLTLAEMLDVDLMVTNASCDAAQDGSITVTASGGVEPYEYSIDGGPFQSNNIFSGLAAGTYEITVRGAGGCPGEASATVGLESAIDIDYPDSLDLCFGDEEQITFTGDPTGLTFSWLPTTGLNDATAPNPVFSPTVTTVYTVTVRDADAPECFIEDQVTVTVSDQINPRVGGDLMTCEPETTLTAESDISATFIWLDSDGDEIERGASLTVPVSGVTNYTLRAEDGVCAEEVMFTVSGGPVDVALPDTLAVCLGDPVNINAINLDANDVLTFEWTPTDAFVEGTTTSATPDYIEVVGTRRVFVDITNQFDCDYQDSIQVAVLDPNATYSFDSELQCDGATVIFVNTSVGAFDFTWDFGDGTIIKSDADTISHVYSEAGTYTVQLTSVYDADCVAIAVEEITVTEPELLAGFRYEIVECSPQGATIAFTDTSFVSIGTIVEWEWTFSDGQTSTLQNPTLTFGEGELTATLTVTSSNDCEGSKTETINISLVNIDLQDQLTICPGESVPLNPDGDESYTYSWLPITGLDDPTAANPTASPASTTIYTVTVQNVAGSDTCTVTDQITVVVAPPINLNIGPDVVTCGEDVVLVANADVDVSVQWVSTVEGDLGEGSTITVNPFRSDTIIAIATDMFNCMERDTVIVTDQGVDVSIDPPSPISVCSALPSQIAVINLDEEDELSYEWSPAANILSGANSDTVTVMVETGSETFQVIVTNQFNCKDTVQVTVTAVPFDPVLPEDIEVCAGVPTPLNPNFTEGYTYEWSPTVGLSDTLAGNPIFTGDVTTVYEVTITDDSQGIVCRTTETITVTVRPPINLTTSGDTALCEITPVILQAETDIDATIVWYDDEGLTNEIGMGNSLSVTPLMGTNVYTAIATEGVANCRDTSTVIVTVSDITDHLPPAVFEICVGDSVALNPMGDPALTYDWQPTDNLDLMTNGPHNPIFIGSETTVYQLTVTDPETGCMLDRTITVSVFPDINLQTSNDTALCEIAAVTLQASTDIEVPITWYDDEGLINIIGSGNTVVVMPTDSVQVYTAIAIDENTGCADTSTVTVTVVDITDNLPPATIVACSGSVTFLNPNGDADLVYDWQPSEGLDLETIGPHNPIFTGTDTTVYTVTVTDPNSMCSLTQTVTVAAPTPFTIEASGDTTLCEAAPVPLTVSSDTEGLTFTWYDNPEGMAPVVGEGPEISVTPPVGTTTYYVIATDAADCPQTDSVIVVLAPILAEITPPQVICEPTDVVTLMVTNLDTNQVLTYQWAPVEAVDPTTGPIVTANPAIAEDYSVTVTNELGCELVLTTSVVVVDPTGIEISADPAEICLGESTQITVTGCEDCTYDWEVPSGTFTPIGDGSVITATPDQAGENVYTVNILKDGCPISLSITVSVTEIICSAEYFFIPNAFTPNGDNVNDVLRMRSNFSDKLTGYELMIYTRWGEEVFRTTDPFAEWDGTYKGSVLPPDVYGYWMQIECPDGQDLRKQGNVSLLR